MGATSSFLRSKKKQRDAFRSRVRKLMLVPVQIERSGREKCRIMLPRESESFLGSSGRSVRARERDRLKGEEERHRRSRSQSFFLLSVSFSLSSPSFSIPHRHVAVHGAPRVLHLLSKRGFSVSFAKEKKKQETPEEEREERVFKEEEKYFFF